MKRNLLILGWAVFGLIFFFSLSIAQCPEDTVDRGECDTLHVEIYPEDQEPTSAPFFVRFPIYVTHDQVYDQHEFIDSIAGICLPLCYQHSNPSKYCSLSGYWNNTRLYPQSDLDRSIFRHFIEGEDTLIHNWMMDLSQQSHAWANIILNLDGTSHFWLLLTPTIQALMGDVDKALIATMTFKIEDTTTICIEDCYWPPGGTLRWSRADAKTYIPRHFFPVCEYVGFPTPTVMCPPDEGRHSNGTFQSGTFSAWYDFGNVSTVYPAGDPPQGITDVEVVFTTPPPQPYVEGYVVYTVTDHCNFGGNINLIVYDDVFGMSDECGFHVGLSNNPPTLNLPDTWRAIADYTMLLRVSTSDPDNDLVEILLDAFWYEPDSLQASTNPPSYDGANPGFLTWSPAEADTGVWIFSFSATDVCGEVDTHQVSIQVGVTSCGDCTGDDFIDLTDVIYLISYLFRGGDPPDPLCQGDANCNGQREIGDVVLLINYLYRASFPPCFECCD